jgi:uncharacterized protein (DUF1697 family)
MLRTAAHVTSVTSDPMAIQSLPSRYVALLRGINVGGKNIIPMAALREVFAELGYTDVATYIQSGNVTFSARGRSTARLTTTIESALSASFGYEARVLVLSAAELTAAIAEAPTGFGDEPERYRYDVLFVIPPMRAASALEALSAKPGVDTIDAGEHALYFRRLIAKAAQSHLSRVVKLPVYRHVTVRNWNTTVRLGAMVGG